MLPLTTAEQFIEQRYELPDAGQWAELVRGVPTCFQAPDVDHGTVVLNLSKALASYVQRGGPGYACFDLGIATVRRPDTVRFPAACYFLDGPRFAEADQPFTTKTPALVIELASSNERRRKITERVIEYHEFGVGCVWVIDPHEKAVHVCHRGQRAEHVSHSATLMGEPPLVGFSMPVQELFLVPEWWNESRGRS